MSTMAKQTQLRMVEESQWKQMAEAVARVIWRVVEESQG
jgi:hypothetical protein